MLDPEETIAFARAWVKEKRWTGEPYDLVDEKLRALMDLCCYSGIEPDQFYAVIPRILTGRAEIYYIHYIGTMDNFATAYTKLETYFETDTNRQQYYSDWTSTTFSNLRHDKENMDKSPREVVRIMLDKLHLCQPSHVRDSSRISIRLSNCPSSEGVVLALFHSRAP